MLLFSMLDLESPAPIIFSESIVYESALQEALLQSFDHNIRAYEPIIRHYQNKNWRASAIFSFYITHYAALFGATCALFNPYGTPINRVEYFLLGAALVTIIDLFPWTVTNLWRLKEDTLETRHAVLPWTLPIVWGIVFTFAITGCVDYVIFYALLLSLFIEPLKFTLFHHEIFPMPQESDALLLALPTLEQTVTHTLQIAMKNHCQQDIPELSQFLVKQTLISYRQDENEQSVENLHSKELNGHSLVPTTTKSWGWVRGPFHPTTLPSNIVSDFKNDINAARQERSALTTFIEITPEIQKLRAALSKISLTLFKSHTHVKIATDASILRKKKFGQFHNF